MLADDVGAVGTTVDQPDGDRRGSGTYRELIAAAGPVTDDLSDELMTQHDVTVRIIERSAGRIVDPEFGVVHEVDVGRADRGAEHPQEKLTGTRYGIRDLADLELTGPGTTARIAPTNSLIFEIFSRIDKIDCRNRPERSQGCVVRARPRPIGCSM